MVFYRKQTLENYDDEKLEKCVLEFKTLDYNNLN